MSKDIRGYFTISSSKNSSIAAGSSKDVSNSDSEDSDIEPVTKKPCHSLSKIHPTSTSSKKHHYLKRWDTLTILLIVVYIYYADDIAIANC